MGHVGKMIVFLTSWKPCTAEDRDDGKHLGKANFVSGLFLKLTAEIGKIEGRRGGSADSSLYTRDLDEKVLPLHAQ